MSGEESVTSQEVAVEPVQEQVATAAPESVIEMPVEAKTFSQEELDAIVSKRLAREQRKWERDRQASTLPPIDIAPAETFESVDAYAEALVAKKLEQREQIRQQTEAIEKYQDREETARGKYDDFEQVAYNPNVKITKVMAEAIHSSELGPEVAYYLGSNPKEADRISRLTPLVQAREIGRVEALVSSNPPVRKTSNAPEPFTPVTARSSGSPSYDTTDARSIKTMTTSEWIAAERLRQLKKQEARKF